MRRWIEGVIAGRTKGVMASTYKMVMTLPSYLYGTALYGRHLLYKVGVFQQVKLPVPVISIGNVICGGTGKTQLVIALVKQLMESKTVGVVTRGYPVHRGEPMRVSEAIDVRVCGDEPKVLAMHLPKAIVVVGKDKVAAAQLAIEHGAELIVLDDGMQHRRLRRDIEIGIGPSSGSYLPCGRLRDLKSRIKHADLVLDPEDLEVKSVGVYSLKGEPMDLPKKVSLFCGIGNPMGFVKTVEGMGCEIVQSLFLADHAKISKSELSQLAKGVDAVLCTEKDRVKLTEDLPYPIGWVKSEMKVVGKQDAWTMTLKKIGTL